MKSNLTLPKMHDTEISPGIFLIGEPTPIPGSNKLRCLANISSALVVLELSLKFDDLHVEKITEMTCKK